MSTTTTPVVKTAALPTGVRLPYVEQGDPTGVPVVLLPGFTDSWRAFALVLPHLPPSIRAFALTQRGYGDADRPVAGYRPADFAADVAAFAATLALGPVVVVGHSSGCLVCQRLALDAPERVRGMVLAGSPLCFGDNPRAVEFWETTVSRLIDPIDPGFVREFVGSTLDRPVPTALLDTLVAESLKVPARVWRAVFAALIEADFSAELGGITAPTLVVWGDHDRYLDRDEQDALVAAIPRARLLVYPGAGHSVHWEEPARFAADLAAFASSVAG